MSSQLQVQLLGILLAITTAIGCIAYEKLVKSSGYFFVGFLGSVSCMPFWIGARFIQTIEHHTICNKWWIFIYLVSGITGPLWYWITKTRTVLTSSIFEVKYIVILTIFSIFIGEKGVTSYTILGGFLAIASIYFISK